MSVLVSPAPVSAIAGKVDPTIVLGSLTVNPAAISTITGSIVASARVWVAVAGGLPVAEATVLMQYGLSNGLLATIEGDMYQVPALRQTQLMVLILHNIHASNSNDVSLYMQRNGGTSRRLLEKTLDAGETLFLEEGPVFNNGDKIRGLATSADEVSWLASVLERMAVG